MYRRPFHADREPAWSPSGISVANTCKRSSRKVCDRERQLRAFAASQSWTVVQEFVDRLSGKTADREQFQLMFQAASVRSFDVLLFWSLDRLSREGTVATLNLQRLNSYGVGYRSYAEQYLDSTGMFKEAVVGILAAVARQERVRLSERTIAGLQRAKAQGRVGIAHIRRMTIAHLTAMGGTGASIRRMAKELGLSPTTVARLVKG
jgi:DNA invertase Pin-like site-specific DNA recombinase